MADIQTLNDLARSSNFQLGFLSNKFNKTSGFIYFQGLLRLGLPKYSVLNFFIHLYIIGSLIANSLLADALLPLDKTYFITFFLKSIE
jgi:hypothetical protein